MLKKSENFKDSINLVVSNSINLQDEVTDEQNGKGRKFVSRFIESGIAHYKEFGDVLITKETLDKFIKSMVGCPVIINHKDITDKNADAERVGVVSNVWYDEKDGWYYCDGIIWDKDAIALIKNQGWNVSCSYDFKSDFESKTHNGKKIDMEFTDGNFLHLALVEVPRYERANIVVNSKNDEDIEWITVKGNHIPIKKGQSKDEAVKEWVSKWENKDELVTVKEAEFDEEKAEKRYSQLKKWISEMKEELTRHDVTEKEAEILKQRIEVREKQIKELEKEYKKFGKKPEIKLDKSKLEKAKKDIDFVKSLLGNSINNSIERKENTVMTALNELEKFVRNIVENVCNNEEKEIEEKEEMKVENEDKRKLIDEVAGMMKSAGCDDEIIRTAIKKMEKIGYEKSEDGTADNRCKNADKEEKEEKFEEEKKIADVDNCGKAKNEKVEVEEEEIDEEKLEENEDKKVENSADEEDDIDKARKLVYNGNSEIKSSYMTRKDRLELGNNY